MTLRKNALVRGLVVGTRKAGTTWLYENFKNNPGIVVSEKVKESSFFTGTTSLNTKSYNALISPKSKQYAIEVDTSICYSQNAPKLINAYNPDMQVVLIFREPTKFLQSRYTHSKRKGELTEADPVSALKANKWLQEELDYVGIAKRFSTFADKGQLTLLPYELLQRDPHRFHEIVLSGLGAPSSNFVPSVERVNVARKSSMPFISALFSHSAKFARRFGGHGLVNFAKGLGVHAKLEKNIDEQAAVTFNADDVLDKYCLGSRAFHAELLEEYNL